MTDPSTAQPAPATWTVTAHFLKIDTDRVRQNLRAVLANGQFFTAEPDTVGWATMKDGDKFEGECPISELDDVLTWLDPATVDAWRVAISKRDETPNLGLRKSPKELLFVRVEFDTRTVKLEALCAGRSRADTTFRALTAGIELVAPDAKETEQRLKVLSQLAAHLVDLQNNSLLRPQLRGKRFELWLGELFELYALESTLDVRNDGEQIDFTFWHGSLFVVGEARWLDGSVDSPQIRDFFGKLRDRPAFAVGLIVSMGGFTEPALDYTRQHAGDRTILTMTRDELVSILRGEPELPAWIKQTLRARLEHPQN